MRSTGLGLIAWFLATGLLDACSSDDTAPSLLDGAAGASGSAGEASTGGGSGQAGATDAHSGGGAAGGTDQIGDCSVTPDVGNEGEAARPSSDATERDVASASASDGTVAVARDGGRDASRSGPLRIMPLGDSTTGSVCWRAKLWQKLTQTGQAGDFDFVGSRTNDAGCAVPGYDQDNEGHPSVLVTNFVNDADDQVSGTQTLADVLGKHPADVVLFHFATNDVWNGVAPSAILTAYSKVLVALRDANPNVAMLVAKLIPMAVTASTCSGCSCPECPGRITTLNDMLPAWASSNATLASPIVVVDQWTGFGASAGVDTEDGVHPNDAGSQKLADNWYTALLPWF